MKSPSVLQKLRPHGVLLNPHLKWMESSKTLKSYLQTNSELLPETPLAAIPEFSLLTMDRLVDADKLGFCADQSFLNGQCPEVLLAHYVSLRFCLKDPWFHQQLLFFKELQEGNKSFSFLKESHVTAPEKVFGKALEYVKQRAIFLNGKPALLPLVDCIPLGRHGNVRLQQKSLLMNAEVLSSLRGVKKGAWQATPYILVTARTKIPANEKLFLYENRLDCQPAKLT